MAERRTILEVKAISDDDCGMYRIGEIDTLPEPDVRAYVLRHGEFGYSEILNFCAGMTAAARDAIFKYRAEGHGPAVTEQAGGASDG